MGLKVGITAGERPVFRPLVECDKCMKNKEK
jgi:hypothetical protein